MGSLPWLFSVFGVGFALLIYLYCFLSPTGRHFPRGSAVTHPAFRSATYRYTPPFYTYSHPTDHDHTPQSFAGYTSF